MTKGNNVLACSEVSICPTGTVSVVTDETLSTAVSIAVNMISMASAPTPSRNGVYNIRTSPYNPPVL